MADKIIDRTDRLKSLELAIQAVAAKPELLSGKSNGKDAGEQVVEMAKVIAEYIADPPTR